MPNVDLEKYRCDDCMRGEVSVSVSRDGKFHPAMSKADIESS